MKVPLTWLKEYVKIEVEPSELMRRLTAVGHMQDGPAKEIAGDQVYDLEVRQNRSDCLSLIGVARETAAVLKTNFTNPADAVASLPEVSPSLKAKIVDLEGCYRFQTLAIEGLTLGPSPEWLKQRLEAYGMNSVNNLVDVTNYVMIEQGQPLHAFDRDKLSTDKLVIRFAREGEELTVLGGRKLTLTPQDLVIADKEHALALAGAIGGEATGVSDATTSILLEAATYNQASIRRTSLRHNVRTEASTRLEKFLHPHLTTLALARAAALITELCGGKVVAHGDAYPQPWPQKNVRLTLPEIERLSGVELKLEAARKYLEALQISSVIIDKETLDVAIPYFRTDLEQEADLVEEVLRLYGYDRIPSRLPAAAAPKSIQSLGYELDEKIRDILTACGYSEQITEPLVNETKPVRTPIRLQNSLSSDKVMLRTTLENQLLLSRDNQRRHRQTDIRLFELGKIYYLDGPSYREEKTLGLLLSRPDANYRELKGVIETLFERLGYAYQAELFTITPHQSQADTFVAQVQLQPLLDQTASVSGTVLTSPPQLILEDWSLIIPSGTPVGKVLDAVRVTSPLVYSVQLGEEPRILEDGRVSIFLNLAYHDPVRTLSTSETDPVRAKILSHLQQQFGAQQR